jgi:predicted GNAT family acetyltransferase
MKDYTWLAVFSVFTLVVGLLFTYGNGTRADVQTPPIQVFVTSTSTPSTAPIIIENSTPQLAPPVITVNVIIATSSLATTESAPAQKSNESSRTSRTYYVTNNTYTTETEEEVDAITLKKEALIVRGEGRVIAFCLFRFIKKGYIVIDDVYVDRAYRKQGIGRLFFTYLTRNCPVQLKVTQDNNANEFYKRIGGILVSIDKGKKRPLNIYRFPPQ